MTAKILIVEDEDDIRAIISQALRADGYDVYEAASGPEAVEMTLAREPQLMILDLMLPGFDGREVCRRLNGKGSFKVPAIIMLTARGEEIDRVVGFELGADDYLTKPFSLRELLLRVKAVLRRLPAKGSEDWRNDHARLSILTLGPDSVISLDNHEVIIEGRLINLTATEFKLLLFMAQRPGRVLSRELLLSEVWGYPWEGYQRTVDTHMRRLRAKLGVRADYLETVRGVGYRFKDRPPENGEPL